MVTILPPATNVGVDIGRGVQSGLQNQYEYQAQQSRLAQTLEGLKNNAAITSNPYLQQVLGLSPLLAHQGGAQLLAEISPVLGRQAQTQAALKAFQEARQNRQTGAGAQPEQPMQGQVGNIAPGMNQGLPGQQAAGAPEARPSRYRQPEVPSSELSTFPQRTAGPQVQKDMSEDQVFDLRDQILEQSLLSGYPADPGQALETARSMQQGIRNQNALIRAEQEKVKNAQEEVSSKLVTRAENSKLANFEENPEARTVISKLALQAANAKNPEEAWEYVRTKFRAYEKARQSLLRNYTQPNLIQQGYRKLNGTYKDKSQAMKDMQPSLDFYRNNGLFDEARADLATSVGFGPEDTELALFPPTKEERSSLDSIASNPEERSKFKDIKPELVRENFKFPGEEHGLNEENFINFKESIAKYLSKHPDTNLQALRGQLNQEKRYDWHDIYKAIDQLIDERRFIPDVEQNGQMQIIRQAPFPGLMDWIKYNWMERK